MVEPLPKWEMKKFGLLWKTFGKKEFKGDEARKILKEKDPHMVSVLFYELNKKGWVEIKRYKKDQRKKIYRLKEPNHIVKEIL